VTETSPDTDFGPSFAGAIAWLVTNCVWVVCELFLGSTGF
jgi:hypothetical protein